MSSDIQKIGSALESGTLPAELDSLRTLGASIKENPEKYRALRQALLAAQSDSEQIALLKGFAISEDKLRTLQANNFGVNALGTITITITITITTWPRTAH